MDHPRPARARSAAGDQPGASSGVGTYERTAAAFVLLAGLGGGCTTTDHKADLARTANHPPPFPPRRRPRPASTWARTVSHHPGDRPRPGPGRIIRADARDLGKGRSSRSAGSATDPAARPPRAAACRSATMACPASSGPRHPAGPGHGPVRGRRRRRGPAPGRA